MRNQMTKENESQRFIKLTDELLKVPHSQIKAKLEEEKLAKKRKKSKKSEGAK
jgi:hypothetical protein